jgi:hypothetical protein
MENFPAVGTVVCGCDEDAACSYHAGMLYGKEHYGPVIDDAAVNAHVADPFRTILDGMMAEARTSPKMAQALDTLYGVDYLAQYVVERSQQRREIHELAKVSSRESFYEDGIRTYCDDCDEWHGDDHL